CEIVKFCYVLIKKCYVIYNYFDNVIKYERCDTKTYYLSFSQSFLISTNIIYYVSFNYLRIMRVNNVN
ncbi:hypothetical protein EJD97_011938, partial [Solanum chilense]